MSCPQVWAAEVKTSLVAAWKRAISYPRGIICQINRNISDFHLLCANFSWARWADFLKLLLADFSLCYFWGLGSTADAPSQISENSKESGAGCSCEFRFWSINRIWVLWTKWGCMVSYSGQSPHGLLVNELTPAWGFRKTILWGSYCWDGYGVSVKVRFVGSG